MDSRLRVSRWWLVAVAALAMGVAGTYQFVWSSIRLPLGARLGASETALGTVFTLFVVCQTVSQFPAGWVRDRWGPRLPALAGAVLLVVGYAGTALSSSIAAVYLFYCLGGVGVGTVYTVAVNTAVKWFDDRRGLATGVVGFAYGGLSFALIPSLRGRLAEAFVPTMLGLAALAGLVTLAAVPFLRDPDPDSDSGDGPQSGPGTDPDTSPDGGRDRSAGREYTWREVVRTWQFWLLYAVFVVVNGVGLMVVGKAVAFAEASGLPTAATAAASLVALGDGLGVVAGGSVSDRLGRERTVAASLVVGGLCLAGATLTAGVGADVAFVCLVAGAAFFRSPAFSVFPSLVGDYYGTSHSSGNYALLYSAKLWGGVGGGTVASAAIAGLGWDATFLVGAVLLVVAGLGTLLLSDPGATR